MATTISVSGSTNADDGSVIANLVINGVSGEGRRFTSLQALKDFVNGIKFDNDDLFTLLCLVWRAKDPTLTPSNVIGHTITINLTAATNLVTFA